MIWITQVAHGSLITGLFTVPTHIIFIVAPFNAVLNYLLGQLLSFVLERHLTNLHSLGPQTNPVGLHRRATRHRDLVQSRFGDVNHLWHLLR